MKIRLASPLESDSIVDGEGIRTVIWTQGCTHNCKGCHNPETHDFKGGFLTDTDDIKSELDSISFQDGITLSGGDPFMQAKACAEIAIYAHEIGLNVWCYSGYTFDQLKVLSKSNDGIKSLLSNIDILIDGKFILEEKSFDVKFRGSKNQRIIDVKRSLESNETILVKRYDENEPIVKREYLFV